MLRWRWHGWAANTALVFLVGFVALLGLMVQSRGIDTTAEWAALLAVLASSGALYLRRRYPVAVGVVALAARVTPQARQRTTPRGHRSTRHHDHHTSPPEQLRHPSLNGLDRRRANRAARSLSRLV